MTQIVTDQLLQQSIPVNRLMWPKTKTRKPSKKTLVKRWSKQQFTNRKKLIKNNILKRPARRVKVKNGRRHLPTVKALKNRADSVFSLFIRKRDNYTCVLCGANQRDSSIQCGHLIKRGKMATRYDEVNCHALCAACNYRDNFDHDIYVNWFVKEYGALPYQDLFDRSRTTVKANRQFFQSVIYKYVHKTPTS